jgi:ribosomal protein S18 acetylase RimI-like enzyme
MLADPKQLERPPWSALTTTHSAFALGDDRARRYRPEFSPLAALRDKSDECLQALHAAMQPGEIVGLFDADPIAGGGDLKVIVHKTVEQMVYEAIHAPPSDDAHIALAPADVPDMMRLVELTQPGPFEARTIALGAYIGIRAGGKLVAMAGERMRFPGFTEISAVCTHPDHRRRGHSSALVRALMRNIIDRGETPFLHIFSDNFAAGSLYEHLGFSHRRTLTVTVLKRQD